MRTTKSLIPLLKTVQAAEGWTNYRLAKELGVTESLIRMLYAGKRGIGGEFLGRIGRRFPGLKDTIWEALIAEDHDGG